MKFMALMRIFAWRKRDTKIVRNREEIILKLCRGKDVLDIGCVGSGEPIGKLHKLIAKVAQSVLGLDINCNGVKILQRQGYNVICGDAENFMISKQFDIIIGGELIEHLSNPGLFLKNAYKHLRPGGLLILTTPNAFSLRILIEMIFKDYANILNLRRAFKSGEHVLWHTEETITALAKKILF